MPRPSNAPRYVLAALLLAASCSSTDQVPAAEVATTTTAPFITIDNGTSVVAIPVRLTEAVGLILDEPGANPIPLPTLPNLDSSDTATNPTQPTAPATTSAPASDPAPSSTTIVLGNAMTTTTQTGSGQTLIQASPMPLSMAAIRGGEAVLLVDTSSGNSVTIRQLTVVVAETDQVGPQAPRSVDIDPVGQNLWYDECCRPPEGTSHAIDLKTDASTETLNSGYPAIDPLGVLVASTSGPTVLLNSEGGGVVASFDLNLIGADTNGTRSGWSQDGTSLAVEISVGDQPAVAIFAIDRGPTATITLGRVIEPPDSKRWAAPTFGADGLLRVVESVDGHIVRTIDPTSGTVKRSATIPVPGIVDIDVDASGTWWLIVDGAGHAHAFNETSLVTLPGDGYSSAAW